MNVSAHCPIYQGAEKAPPYSDSRFKGWFAELADKDEVPTLMPTDLPGFAYFADSLVVRTSQQACSARSRPKT
jgi:multiple sugar transport system substrate-binding protein